MAEMYDVIFVFQAIFILKSHFQIWHVIPSERSPMPCLAQFRGRFVIYSPLLLRWDFSEIRFLNIWCYLIFLFSTLVENQTVENTTLLPYLFLSNQFSNCHFPFSACVWQASERWFFLGKTLLHGRALHSFSSVRRLKADGKGYCKFQVITVSHLQIFSFPFRPKDDFPLKNIAARTDSDLPYSISTNISHLKALCSSSHFQIFTFSNCPVVSIMGLLPPPSSVSQWRTLHRPIAPSPYFCLRTSFNFSHSKL